MVMQSTFLDKLTARGVLIEANGDRLKLTAPAGVVTDSDRAELRRLKPALLKLLQSGAADTAQSTPDRSTPEAARIFYPADAYDPQAAREYALSDESLTPEQRANLLAYADAASARSTPALT